MPFKHPHVALVSLSVEVGPSGTIHVMVIETDLHLNARHPAYDAKAVKQLLDKARAYLAGNANRISHIRLTSSRSGEI